jgi:hypothetical protein
MFLYRLAATVAPAVAFCVLSGAPALAQVPPAPGESSPSTPAEQPTTTSGTVCLLDAAGITGAAHSTFLRGGTDASASAQLGISRPAEGCLSTPSLAERRLIHADLLQVIRDGR